MKWFDSFLNRPIIKILRIDSKRDYDLFKPFAIFIMVDSEMGLLMSVINDFNSIQVESFTLSDIPEEYGLEYSQAILNELKEGDTLKYFIGQTIKMIKLREYIGSEIKGDTFIIKQQKYAGVIVETESSTLTFYNEFGGQLLVSVGN